MSVGSEKKKHQRSPQYPAGIHPLQNVLMENRRGQRNRDTPFDFVYNICREGNTPGYRVMVQSMLRNREVARKNRFVQEKAAGATRLTTYVTEMNPYLRVHLVYTTKNFTPDYKINVKL